MNNNEDRKKLAADALHDLGIAPRSTSKGVTPFPDALAEGSTALLRDRIEARDAYFDALIAKPTHQTTADEKKWLAEQLADFGRQGGFDQ